MKFMSIASGSSGNCILAGSDQSTILIDVGISKKKIVEALNDISMDLKDIEGILITHEHIDHTKGLGVISRSCGIPIYATRETCKQITSMSQLGDFDYSLLREISPDNEFSIGDLNIQAHSIWHDAADPVCYTLKHDNKKISVATDMGDFDDYIVYNLKDSDVVLIEANHDVRMVEVGPYPYSLKQRILGKRGHLSNERSGRLLFEILNDHLKAVFLGHLSNDNNYPELAYETVKSEIINNPYTKDINDFNIQVAGRSVHSALVQI